MVYIFAVLAGAMVILNMSMNASLAGKLGVFRGTFVNYLVGLSLISAVALFTGAFLPSGWAMPAPQFLLGGVLGVIIVSASNVVIPKIPVVYITALFFVGQIFAGLILDFIRFGRGDWAKLAGAALVLSGVLVNALQDAKKA